MNCHLLSTALLLLHLPEGANLALRGYPCLCTFVHRAFFCSPRWPARGQNIFLAAALSQHLHFLAYYYHIMPLIL
ncbi:hypothetical protein BDQ94DRAFT_137282 [Aspergillus welwitschiae]|uniref:Secreted protein n=1 Tax=Aspergillus welwitschiae TaxID=1341132 RepID=A0A3F3QCT2_9EURO|nr:hypothetical protein BDQ94DRAFT_137282 [Aspergillus welwitschiae]RDH37003.1 hypothetical protein BDQ94DRAFT_137282 [Aspergillus welwitschiae]